MSELPSPNPTAAPEEAQEPMEQELPKDLQDALLELASKFEKENREPRTEQVRKIQRAREFFRANQNIWWDAGDRRWNSISTTNGLQTSTSNDDEEMPRYDYVENIFRPHCRIAQSVLSQNPAHCAFAPQDPGSQDDQATAKAAQTVAEFVGDNNKLDQKQAKVAWYLFNDGICASYTHFEKDADKYGVNVVPIMEMLPAQITPDAYHCENCGLDTDVDSEDPSVMGLLGATCQGCDTEMGPQNIQPGQMGMSPQVTGSKEYPKGQERIIYLGGLEVALPYFARTLEEAPWACWESEVHKAWVKSVYPKAILEQSNEGSASQSASEAEGRTARVSLMATSYGRSATESWASLVTLRRFWMRPWSFAHLERKETIDSLTQRFPDGVYVVFAGSTYCESRNERLDKAWALCHADDGDGMIRDGMGEDLIDIQKRLNTEENIFTETVERGIPLRIYDNNTINVDAILDAGALVCQDFEATLAPGEKIQDKAMTMDAAVVSPQQPGHSAQLRGPIAEFTTGMSPSLYGGDTGANDTATGISITQNAALGRVALVKRAMNEFYAATMLNAIECFKENRSEDVQMAVMGPSGELDTKIIHLEDLRGNCYARTDADESFPVSIMQKMATVKELIASPNPQVQAAVTMPDNFDVLKIMLGMQDLKLPGEDARRKQMREIRKMIEGQPVQVDALLDAHEVEMAACVEWASSDEGQQYAGTPVMEAVRQHMMAHLQGKAARDMIAMQPAAAAGEQPAQAMPVGAEQGQPAQEPAQIQ